MNYFSSYRVQLWLFLLITTTILSQSSKDCDMLIQNGITNMMNQQYVQAIEQLSKAEEMARQHQWDKQHFLAINNMGLTYFKMMDYGTAVSHFLKAYELAMLHQDPINEMTVLNNIAIVYMKENKHEQAKEYFLKSLQIAINNQINNRIGYYATNLAQLHYDIKDFNEAKKYVAMALPKLQNEPRVLISLKTVENYLLLEEGKNREVISNTIALIRQTEEEGFSSEKIELQFLLSKAYYKNREWVASLNTAEDALQNTQDNDIKIDLFERVSQASTQLGLIQKALASKDSIIELTHIINKNKNKELLENSTLKFELSESRHALELNKALTHNQKKLYGLTTLLLLLSFLILGIIFYKRSQLTQQKRTIAENDLRIKDLELEQEKHTSQLLKKELQEKELKAQLEKEKRKENERKLRREIEQKNKQLSDKILFQTTRNELIEDIIEKISNEPFIAKNHELVNTVKNLKSHLKEDTKWEEFTSHFENVNNDFIQALHKHHPNLNANDIRFLSFLYLNLNTKEIATLLHISPESCRKRKERVIQKLNIPKEQNLLEYLSQIA